jgi:hypothetical protein
VFFLNLRDIGYSKAPDEVLSAWGQDEALRKYGPCNSVFAPDVIITNHDSKSGEGVERAVARLALELSPQLPARSRLLRLDLKAGALAGFSSVQTINPETRESISWSSIESAERLCADWPGSTPSILFQGCKFRSINTGS